MPNALTHYTFAFHNALDEEKHLDAVFVGAQGPDPFFFYGALPGRKRPHAADVQSLGAITQHMEMTEPYDAMIEYAKKSPDKDLLFAYIDGLFMHYAVDRACHPYIFYFTGFTDRPEDSKEVRHHYNYSHMCLEVDLDVIISHREKTFQPIWKVLALSKKDLLAISKMWFEVNASVQRVPNITSESFYFAIKDYRFAEHFAQDPLGIKKPLFGKLFGKESFAHGIVMPKNLSPFKDVDFLNEKHIEWRMPNGESRHESFDDLLKDAAKTYQTLHETVIDAKKGADVKDRISAIGNHINHEGIVPNSPKIYWKLLWPEWFIKDVIPHKEPSMNPAQKGKNKIV